MISLTVLMGVHFVSADSSSLIHIFFCLASVDIWQLRFPISENWYAWCKSLAQRHPSLWDRTSLWPHQSTLWSHQTTVLSIPPCIAQGEMRVPKWGDLGSWGIHFRKHFFANFCTTLNKISLFLGSWSTVPVHAEACQAWPVFKWHVRKMNTVYR